MTGDVNDEPGDKSLGCEEGDTTEGHTESEVKYEQNGSLEIEFETPAVPDGGWGWFVVLGSFLDHFIIGGIERSAGILYLFLYDRFGRTAAATAWAMTIPSSVRLMFGPVTSMVCNKFSCRSVAVTGSIIFCISVVISAYSPNLEFLYFSFGIVGGIGRSFAYAPAVMMVNVYFNKRRGIAVGLSTCGVGFGTFAVPPLVEMVYKFYGFHGGFFIMAGIALNLAVAGMLFRPLSQQRRLMSFDKKKKQSIQEEAIVPLNEKKTFASHDSLNHYEKTQYVPPATEKEKKKLQTGNDPQEKIMEQGGSDKQEEISKRKKIYHYLCGKKESDEKKSGSYIELSLLKDFRFFSFCVAILLFTLAFQSAFVFLPAYGRQLGNDDLRSTYLVVITGACDGFGRIMSGSILDLKHVKKFRIYIYNFTMFLVGGVSFVIPFTRTYEHLCVVCAIYGILIGTYISQKSVICVDLLGAEKLINSFGLLICFQGVGMLVGPPLSGLLKDINGKYENAFYVGGSAMFLGALILLSSNLWHAWQMRQKREENVIK